MLLYHLTPAGNLARIKREGLVPGRGPRSRRLGEEHPAIYLFVSREDVDQALLGWLGEEMEETRLALLEIRLPQDIPLRRVAFEVQVSASIPPEAIRVLSSDYDG